MLMSAQRNLHGASQGDVALVCADNLALSFKDNSFDLVCSRHASFSAEEVARVLRPGGHFITQQVGRNNTESVLSSFGWNAASFGPDHWGPTLSEAADSFRKLGMEVLRQEEYDVEYWFRDLVSLVLWLRSVPLPEPFDVGLHWRGVKTLVDEHTTSQGIKTNEHRTLLVCESAL